MVLFSIALATLLQRQFSRIAKCRLSFCNFLQEFAQILHEFANTKHTLNLFLLKSSDLEIKRPTLLGKNNKKKLDERSKPVFCLSWLHYSLLLQFVCFFKVRLYCIIYWTLEINSYYFVDTNKKGVSRKFTENMTRSTGWLFCQRASKFSKIKKVGKWQHEFLHLVKISTHETIIFFRSWNFPIAFLIAGLQIWEFLLILLSSSIYLSLENILISD